MTGGDATGGGGEGESLRRGGRRWRARGHRACIAGASALQGRRRGRGEGRGDWGRGRGLGGVETGSRMSVQGVDPAMSRPRCVNDVGPRCCTRVAENNVNQVQFIPTFYWFDSGPLDPPADFDADCTTSNLSSECCCWGTAWCLIVWRRVQRGAPMAGQTHIGSCFPPARGFQVITATIASMRPASSTGATDATTTTPATRSRRPRCRRSRSIWASACRWDCRSWRNGVDVRSVSLGMARRARCACCI